MRWDGTAHLNLNRVALGEGRSVVLDVVPLSDGQGSLCPPGTSFPVVADRSPLAPQTACLQQGDLCLSAHFFHWTMTPATYRQNEGGPLLRPEGWTALGRAGGGAHPSALARRPCSLSRSLRLLCWSDPQLTRPIRSPHQLVPLPLLHAPLLSALFQSHSGPLVLPPHTRRGSQARGLGGCLGRTAGPPALGALPDPSPASPASPASPGCCLLARRGLLERAVSVAPCVRRRAGGRASPMLPLPLGGFAGGTTPTAASPSLEVTPGPAVGEREVQTRLSPGPVSHAEVGAAVTPATERGRQEGGEGKSLAAKTYARIEPPCVVRGSRRMRGTGVSERETAGERIAEGCMGGQQGDAEIAARALGAIGMTCTGDRLLRGTLGEAEVLRLGYSRKC